MQPLADFLKKNKIYSPLEKSTGKCTGGCTDASLDDAPELHRRRFFRFDCIFAPNRFFGLLSDLRCTFGPISRRASSKKVNKTFAKIFARGCTGAYAALRASRATGTADAPAMSNCRISFCVGCERDTWVRAETETTRRKSAMQNCMRFFLLVISVSAGSKSEPRVPSKTLSGALSINDYKP